ncbi:MAG TPA: VWA domain-containing protein [Anaerolineales bacterium]|jgi:Ca-activated chloride channel family protein
MDMLWPGFLYLLGLIPVLIALYIWILRRRKRFRVRFSSLSLVRAAAPPKTQVRRHIPFAIFMLALASLSFAMVRPVVVAALPSLKRTVILSIDVSRSMCAVDIKPNRLQAAKNAATAFVQRQDGNMMVGIVAFAGFAAIIQAPTNDKEVLMDAIDALTVARRTAIGSGILKSIDAIAEIDKSVAPSVYGAASGTTAGAPLAKGAFNPAIIVLLTDGVSNSGPLPMDAAQQAMERGIRVYTIGFGTANNDSFPNCGSGSNRQEFNFGGGGNFGGNLGGFRRGIDEETLRGISDLTGGDYFSAESATELQTVFDKLPTDLISHNEVIEISVFFAALGGLLVGLALILSLLWNPMF